MRTLSLILVICALSATTVGSAQDKKSQDAEFKPLIPLAIGNTWTYQFLQPEESGKLKLSDVSQEVIRGLLVTDVGTFYYLDSKDFGFWLRNTDQGNEDIDIQIDEETSRMKVVGKPNLFYRYPVEKGAKYDLSFESDSDETLSEMTVSEVDLEVKVPAGTFSCIKYESRLKETGELESINYVSPGVGLIKLEYFDGGELFEIQQLTIFRPAKEDK